MVSSTCSPARRIASWSSSMAPSTACSASPVYGGRRSRYGSTRGGGAIENSTGELDIFPGRPLPGLVAQQRCGVIRRDQRHTAIQVHLPAQLTDAELRAEERLRGEVPHREDHLRAHQLEL